MSEINIILGLSNVITAIIMILVVIPLKNGSIKMNQIYGMRISKAFESDENWYKINKYGANRFIIWTIPLFIIGLITFFIPFNNNGILIPIFALAPLIIIIPTVETYIYAKKL